MAWLSWELMCRPKADGGLGFRDLQSFNLALLAKQGWRMLINPDSLLTRIFKARYFPNSSFLEAPLGSRPSTTWRSILRARPFVHQGLRMRIGNGFHTNIWGTPWIPEDGNFKVITPPPDNPLFPITVADLIDPTTETWNVGTIEKYFWGIDHARILAIPIGASTSKDQLVWHYEKHGKFSVRSCYLLIRSGGSANQDTSRGSRSGAGGPSWKEIWSLDIPPKLRMFLWRACRNILPTQVELFRRRISVNPMCPECQLEPETTAHTLMECRGLKEIWSGAPFFLPRVDRNATMWTIFAHLKDCLPRELFLLGLVLCWKVWAIRNDQLHGSNSGFPMDVVGWCSEFIKAYHHAQSPIPSPSLHTGNVEWLPPTSGLIKVNVDVALPSKSDFFRVSGVARNDRGQCLWWYRSDLAGRPHPSDGEAMAMLHGVRAAMGRGYHRVIMETDCFPIFRYLSSCSSSFISFGAILDAVLSLRPHFEVLSFSFTRRSGNSIAHAIATAPFISCNEGSSLPLDLA